MRDWYVGGEFVLALALVLVLALVLLALRRRFLARQGGTFECAMRLGTATTRSGWVLGVARYNEELLEWFRFFSYSPGPRMAFRRLDVSVTHDREPDPDEASALYLGQRIVALQTSDDPDSRVWELAMSSESLTGLLSWLEAAPPGVVGY